MKIGILTHHYVSNYGAFLQAYCLCGAISSLYPNDDVRIVDYVNRKHLFINTGGFLRFYRGRETPASWLQKSRIPGVFFRARKAHMRLTKRVYSASGINRLKCDVLVVGSDEVWNYRDKRSYHPVKFGRGIAADVKLVSYAASVGIVHDCNDIPAGIPEDIARFSSIAVRDENTMRFVNKLLGHTVRHVVDPVFLYQIPDGYTTRVKEITRTPYILFYHCAPLSVQSRKDILDYAHQNGYRLLGAGEYNSMYDLMSQDLTPFEWAELFKRAVYVMTGTFHGVVFSLINKRPFSVCPNNPTRVEKIGSLLSEMGLSDRFASSESFDIKSAVEVSIDYTRIEKLIQEKVQDSLQYLKEAIKM